MAKQQQSWRLKALHTTKSRTTFLTLRSDSILLKGHHIELNKAFLPGTQKHM